MVEFIFKKTGTCLLVVDVSECYRAWVQWNQEHLSASTCPQEQLLPLAFPSPVNQLDPSVIEVLC